MLTYHLICQKQNSFEAELSGAEIEEILQARPQKFHHHHIIVTLCPTPFNGRNTH